LASIFAAPTLPAKADTPVFTTLSIGKKMKSLALNMAITLFAAATLGGCGGGGGSDATSTLGISSAEAAESSSGTAIVKDLSSVVSTSSGTATGKDLSSFVNTYWYVPTSYLQAYRYVHAASPKVAQVEDQTVWHITRVSNGYLLGCAFTSADGKGASWSATTLIGSVAPNNMVSIGFYSSNGVTVGQGTLTTLNNQTAFQMQMSAQSSLVGMTHWAYMLPVTSSDADWSSLPGTSGVSVPTAIAAGC